MPRLQSPAPTRELPANTNSEKATSLKDKKIGAEEIDDGLTLCIQQSLNVHMLLIAFMQNIINIINMQNETDIGVFSKQTDDQPPRENPSYPCSDLKEGKTYISKP